MTLRPEYSLGHSLYNDFLFAAVNPETDGGELTVLSALSRLGIDPWEEAARLSVMPPHAAFDALAATLARLPEARWNAGNAEANAARLIGALPTSSVPKIPEVPHRSSPSGARFTRRLEAQESSETEERVQKSMLKSWLFWIVLIAASFAIFMHLQPGNELEPVPHRTPTSQQ